MSRSRHNAQLRQERDGLKWQQQQQQQQLQRVLLQCPAPPLPDNPVDRTLPPVSTAQVNDFFGALGAMCDASQQSDDIDVKDLDSVAALTKFVGDGASHSARSCITPASAPSIPPPSPSSVTASTSLDLSAFHSPSGTPASPDPASPNSAYLLSTPPLFSAGQRAVIVGVAPTLDGVVVCDLRCCAVVVSFLA